MSSKEQRKGSEIDLVAIDPYSELGSGFEFRFRKQNRGRTRPDSHTSLCTASTRCRGKSGSVHGSGRAFALGRRQYYRVLSCVCQTDENHTVRRLVKKACKVHHTFLPQNKLIICEDYLSELHIDLYVVKRSNKRERNRSGCNRSVFGTRFWFRVPF